MVNSPLVHHMLVRECYTADKFECCIREFCVLVKYRKCGNFCGMEIFSVFVGTQITSKIYLGLIPLVLLYFSGVNYNVVRNHTILCTWCFLRTAVGRDVLEQLTRRPLYRKFQVILFKVHIISY